MVAQISAASNALDQIGFRLIASGLEKCLLAEGEAVDMQKRTDFGRMSTKLA